MTSTTSPTTPTQTVELSPSYALPLALIFLAVPISLLKIWVGFPIALFGLFLMFQTITLRLQFTDTALDIYRSETLIRRFPYQDWLNWRIFWTPVPILFYFKEVKSIHFLPIIFDPNMLKACLEERCPRI